MRDEWFFKKMLFFFLVNVFFFFLRTSPLYVFLPLSSDCISLIDLLSFVIFYFIL